MTKPLVRVLPRLSCISIALLLALVGRVGAEPAKTPADIPESIVAIGDVHGDFDDLVAILGRTGLIDKQKHWTGGKSILVQVGDLLDRGPKPREVMELLMSLEKEASKTGGRVVALLGNHEMMNIMGDLRYVAAGSYASFADSDSEERRKSAYKEYEKWRTTHSRLLAELPHPLELTEAEWMARHPAGFIEQRVAFSSNGTYGKWLREHSAIAQIGGVIFLHGGIHPNLASLKLDAINARIRDEIKEFDSSKQYLLDQNLILPFFNLQEIADVAQAELSAERKSLSTPSKERQTRILQFLKFGDWLSVRVDGPLWFRGYDQWTEEEGTAQIGGVLEPYKATHIVVGHTVQKGAHIRPRFGGKVFLIDTGMLASYYPGGKASALEIRDEARFTAEYLDTREVLVEGKAARLGGDADRQSSQGAPSR